MLNTLFPRTKSSVNQGVGVPFHLVNVKISMQILSLKNSPIYFCQLHIIQSMYIIILIVLQLLIPTYLLCTSWILDSLIVLNWLKLCQKLPTHEKYMSNFKAIIPTVVSMYLRKIVGAVVQGISCSLFFLVFFVASYKMNIHQNSVTKNYNGQVK